MRGANREGGELKGKGGSSFLGSQGAEGVRGRGGRVGRWEQRDPYVSSSLTAASEAPCCNLPSARIQRCNIKVIPMHYSRLHFYSKGG